MLCYQCFQAVIQKIAENPNEKSGVKAEAKGLLKIFSQLDTAVLTMLWTDIIASFDCVNKCLQGVDIDLKDVVHQYEVSSLTFRVCKVGSIIMRMKSK